MAIFDKQPFYMFVSDNKNGLKETCSDNYDECLAKARQHLQQNDLSKIGNIYKYYSVLTKTENKLGGYNREHMIIVKYGFVVREIKCDIIKYA